MLHIEPLVPLSAFLAHTGTRSYQATPVSGLAWKTQINASEEYRQAFNQGTEVLKTTSYAAVKQEVRNLSAQLMGCSPDEITFFPNVSYALYTLIGCMMMEGVGKGDNVITLGGAYATIPLEMSRMKRQGTEVRLCGTTTEEIIAAIDERTRLVAIEASDYVTCKMFDLEKIADAVHAVGGRIVIDVSQAAGVIPLSLAPFDALVATCAKWLGLGSNGVALCWVNRERWPNITPESVGWYSTKPFSLPFTGKYEMWEDGQRLEQGGLPWPLLYNLRDSLRNLLGLYTKLGNGDLRLGQHKVEQHVKDLGDLTIAAVNALDMGLTVLSPRDSRQRGSYISVKMTNEKAKEVCSRLNAQGIYLSMGQGRLRIAPWIYNGSQDVEIAVPALGIVLREMGFDPTDSSWVGEQ